MEDNVAFLQGQRVMPFMLTPISFTAKYSEFKELTGGLKPRDEIWVFNKPSLEVEVMV